MSDDMNDDLNIDEAINFGTDDPFVTVQRPTEPSTTQESSGEPDAGGINQVRDILLGPLATELQTRMTQLGQRLDGSMLELDRRTAERVTELETRLKDGMDAMVAEFAELKDEQTTMMQQVRDELEAGTRSLNEKLEALGGRFADERKAEIQSIRDELQQLTDSIASRLECETEVLRSELVDRNSLASALSEVAMRLSGGPGMSMADADQTELDLEAALETAARNS